MMTKQLFFAFSLFFLVSCGGNNKINESDKQNVDTVSKIATENSKQVYTFNNFISDCIKVNYSFFDTELDIEKEYPQIYHAEPKNEDKVISYLVDNYKADFAEYPASVSIPLLFTANNYDVLLVEYQDEVGAICNDFFIIDKTGKLINEVLEITYHNIGSSMITDEYLKIRKGNNNTFRIVTKQVYEARTKNAALPDSPDYHFYEIKETGQIIEKKKEDFGDLTGYNFTLKENNIETEYCFEFVDIGAQYATKKQILQDSSISIKSGMYTQEKNTVNIEWTKHFGTKAADEKGQENKKVFIPFSEKIKESQALNIYDILGKLFTAKKYILDSVSSAKPTDLLYFCLKSKYLSFPFIYFSPSEEMDLFEPENSISPVFLSKEIEFFGQDAMPDIINKIAKVAQMKFFSIGSFYTSYNYKVFLMAFLSKFAEADIANYHIAAFVISPVNELKSAFYLFIGDENNMNDVKLIDENGNFIYTDKFEKFQVNVKLNASGSAETFGNYKEIE